ncbi:hypothetical protein BKA70DRAFT_1356735 [Coprinopsis sp. MPI-PUGE-AT-0042]|nr:hypothetical protein BKA70DRAFT_1356735 [Coprinopsis sp. MPI-PUGE-AT-0042]
MDGAQLTPGVYALINDDPPRYALDAKGGSVVAYPYITSPLQQWNLTTPDRVCWWIQNVQSGRYLGLPANAHVKNSLTLQEVDHKFAWHIRKHERFRRLFILYVPYSKHVVDICAETVNPGSRIRIYQDGQASHQSWNLCKDLHLDKENSTPITNATSNGSLTVYSDVKGVSCVQPEMEDGDPEMYLGSDLRFRAFKTNHGWAFQHVQTGRYLGIPHTIMELDEVVQLSTVEKPFTWMIIPYHGDSKIFEIFLPFTSRALETSDEWNDKRVYLRPASKVNCLWWRFRPCKRSLSSSSYESFQSGGEGLECIPGPEDGPSCIS